MTALAAIVIVLAEAAAPLELPAMQLSGNGGLTIGLGPSGRLFTCRWPSPGYQDHMHVSDFNIDSRPYPPNGGACWGLVLDDGRHWLVSPEAQQDRAAADSSVIETQHNLPTGHIVKQATFVHPVRDILVLHLEVIGPTAPASLYWYQNFDPSTRSTSIIPFAATRWKRMDDFAAFADAGTAYQFRPKSPGRADWNKAREWAGAGSLAARSGAFSSGVWIGARSGNVLDRVHCGVGMTSDAAHRVLQDEGASWRPAAAGQCHVLLQVAPKALAEGWGATLYLAFGRDRGSVDEMLQFAMARGYDGLRHATDAYWRAWTTVAGLTLQDSADEDLRKSALLTILQCTDRATGAVVQPFAAPGLLPLDWPRRGVWANVALDKTALHDLASRHLRFYAEAVRRSGGPGRPRGSLAMALCADGQEGVPHVVLDTQAAAWFLADCHRHSGARSSFEAVKFLQSVWEAVALCADFLAAWSHPGTGAPAPAYDPALGRDGESLSNLLTTYMGVRSALEIARKIGESAPPDWAVRRDELDSLVQFHLLNAPRPWAMDPLIYHGIRNSVGDQTPAWFRAIEAGDAPALPECDPAGTAEKRHAGTLTASLQFLAATARLYGAL